MSALDTARDLWERRTRLPQWVFDAVLATVLVPVVIVSVVSVPSARVAADYRRINALGILLVLAAVLPFYVRRRYPLFVLVNVAVFIVLFIGADYYEGALPLLAVIATYTVGSYCVPRQIVIGGAVVAAALVAVWIFNPPTFHASDLFVNLLLYSVALLVGWAVQSRRLRLRAAEERAELLEREQEEERARVLADERLRIAQELHDVVAHSMSVIAVQAGVGLHVVDDDPAEAKQALQHISDTSRSSLTELRRLLGVLRDDGSGASYAPAPGLDDLGRLASEVTAAGVPVEVTRGGAGEAPPGVEFTAYRIVQEALTNVLKHAGPSRAWVTVTQHPGMLVVEVCDDGRGVNGRSPGGGHGLVGMRERVAVYGGRLDAGPRPGGGYRVLAELPYGAQVGAS